ncbi:hypothetical protein CYLTODRAFT_459089 [Cylindrobasidium torrendii FP15055 ss-10]|uniref:Uncharacterized protein n=1 Tax=Cylindrobasidium torrendii FP15055 ss-10 TaxID=1314674 RepID=A0A0D7AYH9_9AGAR|nr:hypothetical protein CYLTODRAFT_459089 [Cylindrobasidium torrendii FP15055 ss-10]
MEDETYAVGVAVGLGMVISGRADMALADTDTAVGHFTFGGSDTSEAIFASLSRDIEAQFCSTLTNPPPAESRTPLESVTLELFASISKMEQVNVVLRNTTAEMRESAGALRDASIGLRNVAVEFRGYTGEMRGFLEEFRRITFDEGLMSSKISWGMPQSDELAAWVDKFKLYTAISGLRKDAADLEVDTLNGRAAALNSWETGFKMRESKLEIRESAVDLRESNLDLRDAIMEICKSVTVPNIWSFLGFEIRTVGLATILCLIQAAILVYLSAKFLN